MFTYRVAAPFRGGHFDIFAIDRCYEVRFGERLKDLPNDIVEELPGKLSELLAVDIRYAPRILPNSSASIRSLGIAAQLTTKQSRVSRLPLLLIGFVLLSAILCAVGGTS
jgi:hypothetical protein